MSGDFIGHPELCNDSTHSSDGRPRYGVYLQLRLRKGASRDARPPTNSAVKRSRSI